MSRTVASPLPAIAPAEHETSAGSVKTKQRGVRFDSEPAVRQHGRLSRRQRRLVDVLRSTTPQRADFDRYVAWNVRRADATIDFIAGVVPAGDVLDVSSAPHFSYLLHRGLPHLNWAHTAHDGGDETLFRDRASGETLFHYKPMSYFVDEHADPPPGRWDAITFLETAEHLAFNPGIAFATLATSLKHNGVLVVSTPNVGSLRSTTHALRGGSPHQTPFFPRQSWFHTREYGVYEMRQLLEWAGFEVLRLRTRDVHDGDPRGWRAAMKRLGIVAGSALALDPAALRHAILHLGGTQFIAARKIRPARPLNVLPQV